MPETSIAIKIDDRYSSVLRSMSDVTKAFDKNAEHLEKTLHELSGEKSILQAETNKARRAMLDAQKQFAATGDEADALRASLAGREYEDYRRKLEAINRTMKETEKQIQSVSGAAKSSGEKVRAFQGGIHTEETRSSSGRSPPTRRKNGARASCGKRKPPSRGGEGGEAVSIFCHVTLKDRLLTTRPKGIVH